MLHVPPKCAVPDKIAKVDACWDQSQLLYDLVQKVLLDVLATDPQVLPQPPAVTDGSQAAPGTVGEVWSAQSTGTWANGGSGTAAPGQNFVVAGGALPAGDWDVTWNLTIPDPINAGLCLMPVPPAGAYSNMAAYAAMIPNLMSPFAPGYIPFLLNGPSTPITIPRPLGLVFSLYVWPQVLAATGTWTFNVGGRRRR